MEKPEQIEQYRIQNSIEQKNGVDFTLSATLIWFVIGWIWTTDYPLFTRAIITFYVGFLTLPTAIGLSKIMKTNWSLKQNPLKVLGLWFNLAQLFYFPFLFFMLYKTPEFFVMGYAIITGAHFFLFSWYYKTMLYGLIGGIISLSALLIALSSTDNSSLIAFTASALLAILSVTLWLSYRRRLGSTTTAV